jgi:hypothetical protein
MEPLYLVETHARRSDVDAVAAVIVQRRGQVLSSDPVYVEKDNVLCKIRAYLPVVESFGFASAIAREASGACPPVSFALLPPHDLKLCRVCVRVCVRALMCVYVCMWRGTSRRCRPMRV